MVSTDSDRESYIRNKAILYGANDTSVVLTLHQQEMNKASQSLAIANPNLLNDRRKLIQLARIKVDDDGYIYKHGKSRSKHLYSESDTTTSSGSVKQAKTTETERLQRIAYVEETMNDIKKQIGFKEKRRDQLTNVHNYGECEKISDEISSLKKNRFELRAEQSKLQRQQQQCEWYKQNKLSKKQKKLSISQTVSDASDTESNILSSPAPSVQSSRSNTPAPGACYVQSPIQLLSDPNREPLSHAEVEIVEQDLSFSTPRCVVSNEDNVLHPGSDESSNF